VRRAAAAAILLVLILAACAPKVAPVANSDSIESDIDKQMGGVGTCVVLEDTKTGAVLYQYNTDVVCKTPLPPCATFNIVTSLVGLDDGVITPTSTFRWDGTPQPVTAWQTNADITKAYKNGINWWFQRLGGQIGQSRYAQALNGFGYGNKNAGGPAVFWNGPQSGGNLAISTRGQAQFLQRLYAGKLPVKAGTSSAIENLMVNETRTGAGADGGQYVMSGETGSCASQADGSANVGWWVGRLKTPKRDIVFAASVNGATAPPGEEVEATMKDILADGGFWPQG
jgi:beta-lactamase class D